MTDVLVRLRAGREAMLADLERLVMVESPSEDLEAVQRGCVAVADLTYGLLGQRPKEVVVSGRPHLLLQTGPSPRVLLLGHLDTVWPLGTTQRWPFSADGTTVTGPGVFDMKAGLVQGLHALSRGIDLDDVAVLISTDEEIGSETSRQLIEKCARTAGTVLVLEPSAAGAIKTSRKGVSMYGLDVDGRAAHAGLDPESGVNALLELGDQLRVVAGLGDQSEGTTVSPTRATAGATVNTIPAAANAQIDVRAWTAKEQRRVDDAMHRLLPVRPGATLRLRGGINRPPLEASMSASLFERAQRCADVLGLEPLAHAAVGGASDGNFTAAVGVPTLDGMGAVGDGAHAEGEHVVIDAMADRAALLHALLTDLLRDPDNRGGTRET